MLGPDTRWSPLEALGRRAPTACVGAQLEVFGIPHDRITKEVEALPNTKYGKNRSRPLLGILNEVAFQFEVAASEEHIASPGQLLEIQTELNGIPHRAASSSCVFARDSIVALLGDETVH